MSERRIITSELNVEFAHLDWSQASTVGQIRGSLDAARRACAQRGWQFESAVRSILVDDKDLTERPRAKLISEIESKMESASLRADFMCFESDLRLLLPKFVSNLGDMGGERQAKSMKRYLDSHGRTACSHDIAIWHAFRLGLLGRRDELLHCAGSTGGQKDRFYSRCVVSSIRRSDMQFEAEGLQLLQIAYGTEIAQNVATIGYDADD